MFKTTALIVLAALSVPSPAAAATPAPELKTVSYLQLCPGILCAPFWTTDRIRILRKAP